MTFATASGSISGSFKVMTGTIGSGTCKAGGTCYVEAANAAKTTEAAFTTFTFAGGATAPTSSAPISATPTTGRGAAPTAVDAGSGGNAGQDGNGVPDAVLVLAGVGAITVGAGAWRLSRR